MCFWRRVYFSCQHEDANVTPPRPVKPCPWAILRGSIDYPVYCPEEQRGLSARFNFQDAVIRDRPCMPCQEMQLKRRLDEEWHAFSREFLWKSSEKEMVGYVTSRQQMFTNNHFEFWEQLQALFINKCRYDMRDKPYMYGEEYMGELKEDDKWPGNSAS